MMSLAHEVCVESGRGALHSTDATVDAVLQRLGGADGMFTQWPGGGGQGEMNNS